MRKYPKNIERQKIYFSNSDSGRSMVEILGVLAIIGILSVGGLVGYQMAIQKSQKNKCLDEMQMVFQKFYEVHMNIPIPKPEEEVKVPDSVVSLDYLNGALKSLNGKTSVSMSYCPNQNMDFMLSFDYLPEDVCLAILNTNWEGNIYFGDSSGLEEEDRWEDKESSGVTINHDSPSGSQNKFGDKKSLCQKNAQKENVLFGYKAYTKVN